MNTLRIENLRQNAVLDQQAKSTIAGGWFSAVVKVVTLGYSAYKNRKTIKKYAKKGYGYARKIYRRIF